MAQVKLIRVYADGYSNFEHLKAWHKTSEERLTQLVNDGWRIVAAGGSEQFLDVILQKD